MHLKKVNRLLRRIFAHRYLRNSVHLFLLTCLINIANAQPVRMQILSNESELLDTYTGLIWKRCPQGQTWNEKVCTGAPSKFSFDAAMVLTENPSGWRIPNVKELFSIVRKTERDTPSDLDILVEKHTDFFWTSTPNGANSLSIWSVDFSFGSTLPALRQASHQVHMVRNAPDSFKMFFPQNDTGISSKQCLALSIAPFVDCNSSEASLLSKRQDGMVGLSILDTNPSDGEFGFSFLKIRDANQRDLETTECIVDSITGLMWEGKPTDGGYRDFRNRYTNFDSSDKAQVNLGGNLLKATVEQINSLSNSIGYRKRINEAKLCGFSDWRLPTADELTSIVHFGRSGPPAIDVIWFPNTNSQFFYWTSDPAWINQDSSKIVNFSLGRSSATSRSTPGYIRLVRSLGRNR